jgi:non-homologous end joining protein Ku
MTNKSSDEQPKQVIAKQVITSKRKYFNPEVGEVEADTPDEAAQLIEAKLAATNTKETEVGDGR